ncbi:oligosaccharide flippase family protein [bacterium]|nr:oligosaccharide flippase family protein [bacterium]
MNRTFKVAMLASGNFFVTLTGLVTAAVLSRVFTKGDYAVYKQTLLAYRFVAPILTLGLPQALFYFIPLNRKNSRSLLSSNFTLLFLMGLVFAISMLLGGNVLLANQFSNPALKKTLLIYAPYGFLALPATAIGACLIAFNRVKTLTIYNVLRQVVVFIVIVIPCLIWRTPEAAITGAVIGVAIVLFPAIYMMYSSSSGTSWLPNRTNMWEQLKYSVPLGMAHIVGNLQVNIDKFIVSSMCSPEDFAIYVNGAVEIPLVGMITGSIISILIPEFVELYRNGEFSELVALWRRTMIKTSYLVFPVMVYLFIMSDEFIQTLFSSKYTASVVPFRIYLIFLMARITNFGSVEMAAGKSQIVLFITIGDLIVNIIFTIILVPIIGYIGAAIGTVMTTYLFAIPVHMFVYKRILKTPISKLLPLKKLSAVMLGSLACLPLTFSKLLIPDYDILKLAVTSAMFFTGIVVVFRITGIGDLVSIVKSLKFGNA